jgi:transcriptional regulator with GAF, ATPase, and Fis domain
MKTTQNSGESLPERGMSELIEWKGYGRRLPAHFGSAPHCPRLVGRSPAMGRLCEEIEILGRCDVPVLLSGETGVGKNLVARAIHDAGPRAGAPFLEFCAANLAEALFESELFGHVKGAFSGAHQDHPGLARAASGGTLFVNEVGELTPANQAKLLHFLDSMEVRPVGGLRFCKVDVRVLAATNRDLQSLARDGSFRRDLFFRLAVVSVRVPSLRERREDIPLLANCFLDRFARQQGTAVAGLSEGALALLLKYDWPGNVRELENTIRRAVVMTPSGQRIEAEALQLDGRTMRPAEGPDCAATLGEYREKAEREVILHTLSRHEWNVCAAARDLRITRVGLSRKLKRLEIVRPGRHAGN